MTATGHAIIGTVIAVKIGNPALALPLAFASHFFADAFPHWDTGTNKTKKTFSLFFIQSIVDLSLSFIIPYFLIQFFFPQTNIFYALLCILAAQLPDWMAAPYVFLNWNFWPFTWMYQMQTPFDNRLDKPWGIINQVGILLFLVAFALLM